MRKRRRKYWLLFSSRKIDIVDKKMNAEDYLILGNKKFEEGNYLEAISNFDSAIQLNPLLENAHFGRGLACYQIKDNRTAEAAFSAAIQLRPNGPGAGYTYALRCLARANLDDRTGAIEDYKKAIALDIEMAEFLQSQTCIGTSQAYILASMYPAQFTMIVERLTRA